MNPLSSSTSSNFSLYGKDLRDPKEILRSRYDRSYQNYKDAVVELERIQLRQFCDIDDGDDTEVDRTAQRNLDLEDDSDPAYDKENAKPSSALSISFRKLPAFDDSKGDFTSSNTNYIKV